MNEASTVTFGAWLRWRRRSLDLTQAELALLIPCAKGTVRRLEADDLRPSKQLAERLAVTLGVLEPTRDRFLHFARTGWQAQSSLEQFTTNSSLLPPPNAADLPLAQSMRRYLLPVAPNPLLGRAHASSIAIEMLRQPEVRLVTLVGPPGVGKTRLALQIAEQIQPYFREGVCFVPLAPLNRADQVLPAIAQALDLLDSGRALETALTERLRGEALLLLLDNLEHVITVAPTLAKLLATAPSIKLLCTSRLPLRITGEHEFLVPPLALPVLANSSELALNPAVALFVARARAVRPELLLTPEDLQIITQICHRLDGLPLALELAATRIKLFAPSEILTRLERRLPFLTGGARDAPDRQRTLAAAIAWSYDLLSTEERICLARLAIFWGGWTLVAAEQLCGEGIDLLGALTALVDHSLVQTSQLEAGEMRYFMLETIREFALNRLFEDESTNLLSRHAHYFLTMAVEAEQGLQRAQQVAWMRRLNTERYNLHEAFTRALITPSLLPVGLQAGAALWWFWWTNGQVGEGRQWLDSLLRVADEQSLNHSPAYARALLGSGILAFFAGDFAAAMPRFVDARQQSSALGDTITHGYAIFMIGTLMLLSGQPAEGENLLEQGSQIMRSAGAAATWHVGVTSLARVLLSFERGALTAAQHHADTGLALLQQLGQPYGIGLAYNYQGDVARLRGDHTMAAQQYELALPLLREANAKSEIPAVLHNLAHSLLAQSKVESAQALFLEGLSLHHAVGNRMGMIECWIGLAAVAVAQHQPHKAVALLAQVDATLSELKVPLFAAEQQIYEQVVHAVRTETLS